MATAFVNTGKIVELNEILGSDNIHDSTEKQKNKENELEEGIFTIKEVKPGKSGSTVWAVAFAEDGAKFTVCSKNGNGKTLQEADGKKARVKYRHMSERKLYAVSVEIRE